MRTRVTPVAPVLLLALAACGTTTSVPPNTLALDRPIDVAFGCFGTVRMTGGGRAGTTADPIVSTAVPVSDCDGFTAQFGVVPAPMPPDPRAPPLGQEDLTTTGNPSAPSVNYYAFVLQSVPGTIAVATWVPKPATQMVAGDVQVIDLDPLQPGASGLSVGALPVGIATDRNGCFEITANAGTCDLSTLDITSALKSSPDPIVDRVDITNATGAKVLAKPQAIAAEPVSGTIGVACPAAPVGIIYVAYPDCHRVAAVDTATGQIKASILFAADGTATLTDGNFTCPVQCGEGAAPTAGVRPTSLDLLDDPRVDGSKAAATRRLAIGAENSNKVTVVDLGIDHLPTGTPTQVTLEGSIGISDLALTPQIGMGGDLGTVSDDSTMLGAGPGGQFQFVYAVASDGTVRVADVLNKLYECDTEIDPRYLTAVTDVAYVSCIKIGSKLPLLPPNDVVPPRRPGATSPGIQLIGDARPIAVTIAHAVPATLNNVAPAPVAWMGYFAIVTATTGSVYVVNVDDDNYPDVDDPTKPVSRWIPLALAHQLRDNIADRSALAEETDPTTSLQVPVCNTAGSSPDVSSIVDLRQGPHLWPTDQTPGHPIAVATSITKIGSTKIGELPTIRQVLCTGADTTMPVSELAFSAPTDVRKTAFPDLRGLRNDETWTLTWEGPLSNDSSHEMIDGPIIRIGEALVDGNGMRIVEDTHPFCDVGVEPYDEVILRGCDPTVGGQCGYGNTCYAHPQSTTGVGSCLPTDQVDTLAGPCKSFLVSQRRYAVTQAKSGELRLIPRRHVLRTTPITGCMSADQCNQLAVVDARLPDDSHPFEDITQPALRGNPPHAPTWACEPDPSRPDLTDPTKPGPNQCIMSCTVDTDCDDGTICDGGRCVEGVVPPLQCLTALQRYEIHADRAFTVIGTRSGYLHPITADSSGTCVRDPAANPLQIGRIPLSAPPCVGDGLTALSPNPCEPVVKVKQTSDDPVYVDTACNKAAGGTDVVTRDASSIRFRNPAMTFELVDPTYPGDATCTGDRGGTLKDVPYVFPGYALQLRIASGFLPYLLSLSGTVYPINVVRGPLDSIWVEDEGDFLSATSASTRGRVYRVEATAPEAVNMLQ